MSDTWSCVRCGKDFTGEYRFLSKGNSWSKACVQCYVDVWDVPIHFIYHWGIPDWVEKHMKTERVLDNLRNWFRNGPTCYVHFFLRSQVDTLKWQYQWNTWDHERTGAKPFSYRGWCSNGTIIVIVDDHGIETPESIEWITYHELGHHESQKVSHMADAAWYKENANVGNQEYNWEDDVAHEADAEEKHVNRMATAFMGGREYARPWWRKRVDAFLAGEKPENFPDCHAKPEVIVQPSSLKKRRKKK